MPNELPSFRPRQPQVALVERPVLHRPVEEEPRPLVERETVTFEVPLPSRVQCVMVTILLVEAANVALWYWLNG